jgi:hypothetical protein
MRWLLIVLLLTGCSAKLGPGEHGWAKWSLWEGFNFDLEFPTKLCLGCLTLETEEEENGEEEREEESEAQPEG